LWTPGCLFAPSGLAFALVLEHLSRIAMVTAWPPVAIASDACTLKIGLCLLRRRPEPPPRKPFHLGVGMFLANPVERRQ
jgi:hypothetical protein